ncbi:hypothetical protein F2Q69_00046553 [Brassica cretica]|uniref:Uncharacterized protein n=1 Tax=Brassica cretica TaxID=69181 RepID=A0A8S9PL96_BRACR|nr:hypothetical protein F2Q69_00046553 [Brassica cretica]
MRSLRWTGPRLYLKDSQFREGDRVEYQFRMTATVLDNVTQKQMLKFLRLQLSCSIHVLKLFPTSRALWESCVQGNFYTCTLCPESLTATNVRLFSVL